MSKEISCLNEISCKDNVDENGEGWYQALTEIFKTGQKPDNFDEKREYMLTAFKDEVIKRTKNILDTPRFNRRQYSSQNYRFRKKVIERDKNICFDCKKIITNRLQVAHILPVELFPEYAFEEWNGIVKCQDCHKKDGNFQIRRIQREIRSLNEKLAKTRNYSNI